MNISVRLSGDLAKQIGQPRIGIPLEDGACIADLQSKLCAQYPSLENILATAVPVIAGRHATADELLSNGQEVALLVPIAGG